jgi:hypothetical protein
VSISRITNISTQGKQCGTAVHFESGKRVLIHPSRVRRFANDARTRVPPVGSHGRLPYNTIAEYLRYLRDRGRI